MWHLAVGVFGGVEKIFELFPFLCITDLNCRTLLEYLRKGGKVSSAPFVVQIGLLAIPSPFVK